MNDKNLYQEILGLKAPWQVEEVVMNRAAGEIVIRVGLTGPIVLACPECNTPMPGYDTKTRRWRHLDTCQLKTIIESPIPRGDCPVHGVKQIRVPWAEERSRFTAMFERLAIDWIQEAGQTAAGRCLRLSWDEAHGIMHRAVARGLSRRGSQPLPYLGVDEKSFQKRHEYVTTVCDLEKGHVLYVADNRKQESLDEFYKSLSQEQLESIKAVAMDMWDAYVSSTMAHVPEAVTKIVFDKFHITQHLCTAVDKVRRQEHKALSAKHDETLKGTKYLWLRNPENFTDEAWKSFKILRESSLKSAKAWAMKETIMNLWKYSYVGSATKFFKDWYGWVMHSRLEPMKEAARLLARRLDNILTYLKHHLTNAVTESINSKIQWIKYTARGFRNRENYKTAILFHCGGLNLYPLEIL